MHSMLYFIMVAEISFTAALINPKVKVKTEYDLGPCNNLNHGHFTLVKNNENKERLVICTLDNGIYHWTTTGGRSSSGEFFNPAYDCSEILNKNPKATDGFYWVNFNEATSKKVYCDMNTDGGGYMLIAKKNDPKTWSVPSNSTHVDPFGNDPHWSSSFGNAPILDFRIQVSSTSKFQETKAHWSYRLQKKRPLKNLMVLNEGGCARRSPGIGHIAYVKDLMTGKVVSTTFRCSIFSGYSLKSAKVGWSMMNICLKEECSGFGVNHKDKFQTSDTGAFSYSATNTASGITKAATAFLGCDIGECCACYGPVGGTGDYCDTECRAKNGGTVIRNVHTWVWLRSSLPKTLWTKCMEYEATSEAGQKSWYSIVGNTGEPQKGRCPGYTDLRLNDGTIVAQDGNAFKKIPDIPGLLSYRKDNKKLYVSSKNNWIALSTEDKYNQVSAELKRLEKKFETLQKITSCKQLKQVKPSLSSGSHSILGKSMYCDMSSGWTLVARFSNSDSKNWMQSSGYWWYDKVSAVGRTTDPSDNNDMISDAFWGISGNEIKITRSDDSSHTALLQTTSNCLNGKTFRQKITSYGDFRNGKVWASDACLGNCQVSYGGNYQSTAGFEQHSCNGNIQNSNYIGFWCDWDAGDGAVMMVGGGGASCQRADHGIGITEENAAKFNAGYRYWDFGHDAVYTPPSSYSLNLWVR